MKKEEIAIIKKKMSAVGLDEETVAKECSFALQAIGKSKQLQGATIQSKQSAIINIAQTGLTLNPVMKLAYLVPRWIRDGVQCCLEPSYQGLVKLLTDSGSIETINAQLVYENDFFETNSADFDNPIIHKPDPFNERGNIIGVYAIAMLKSGTKQAETMSVAQLHEIREMSESYKAFKAGKMSSCVWIDHEGEMMRKTVVRRIVKYLPKTQQFERVAKAIDLDEGDYKASESHKQVAYNMLENSDVVERMEIASFENKIEFGSPKDVNEVIENLKDRQKDNGRYGASEINEMVEQIAK